jgi:nucleoid-associated protein YgaU
MSLEKARIKQLPNGPEIAVMFNPTEYSVSKSNTWDEQVIPGLGPPFLQFGHGEAQVLSMKLFFDTYDPQSTDVKYPKNQDVRVRTRGVTDLLQINAETHAPPIIQFSWGNFVFVGIMQKADVHFNLFLPSGVPVRATVDVTIKQWYNDRKETGMLQSANYAKQHVVLPGDTLPGIASKFYDDPAKWRPIAVKNNIDDPLALEPGRELIIPAIE